MLFKLQCAQVTKQHKYYTMQENKLHMLVLLHVDYNNKPHLNSM